MQCPTCGNENSYNARTCNMCKYPLRDNPDRHLPVESRISKLAILSLVLGISSLLFFVLTGIPAILVGIISILKIHRSGGKLKGKSLALTGALISIPLMFISFMCIFFMWCLDTPPIPNDYTVADLRSAPAQCAESFELLKSLTGKDYRVGRQVPVPDVSAIGLSEEDIDILKEISEVIHRGTALEVSEILSLHAKNVEQAWAKAEKARDVIAQLNAFTEIADLAEPSVHGEIMFQKNFIELARLYQAYAHLQTEQGNIQTVTMELIELDSVFRKLSLNVRPLIAKLVCLLCMELDIETANGIANNPRASRQAVELLAQHFRPVTKEQMSLRNGVLFIYLVRKDFITKEFNQSAPASIALFIRDYMLRLYRNIFPPPEGIVFEEEEFDYRVMMNTPLFKRNSTLRWFRNACDARINALEDVEDTTSTKLSVWPDIYPFTQPVSFEIREPLPLLYRCYNPIGSILVKMIGFWFRIRTLSGGISTTKVKDDILQIILNKRLGKEFSLKAAFYGDEYVVDIENKQISSPGPDGRINTRDDIKLRINPEVLGW